MENPITTASTNNSGTVLSPIQTGRESTYGIANGMLRKKRNGSQITKENGKKFQTTFTDNGAINLYSYYINLNYIL